MRRFPLALPFPRIIFRTARAHGLACLADAIITTFWCMMGGMLVFIMQLGFALLEAGSVRSKNTKAILIKNLLDTFVSAMAWYAVGWSLA